MIMMHSIKLNFFIISERFISVRHYQLCFHGVAIAMQVLDGDDVRLSSRGREAERDIVQV